MKNIKSLYSYRQYKQIELENIKNNVAYFGKMSDFNDPEEGMVFTQLLHNGYDNFEPLDVLKAGFQLYNKFKPIKLTPLWFVSDMKDALKENNGWEAFVKLSKITEKLKIYRDNLHVLCLSPLDNNSLMWAHYADGHKGYCLEYELNKNSMPKDLSSIPINYTNTTKIYSCTDLIFNPDEVIARLCFTKKTEWSYEEERRIILTNGNPERKFDDKFKLISVTCGTKTPNKSEVHEICKKKNLRCYEVRNMNVYGLKKVEIDPHTGRQMRE